MTDAEMNLDSFQLDYIWTGKINAPWLGRDLHAFVDAKESGIAESQYACMRTACRLPKSTLEKTKIFLFDRYQAEIYGSIAGYRNGVEIDFHEITPKVENKEQLWKLLSQIGLSFPAEHRIADHRCFALTAQCVWDEEHGLEILFDKNGNATDIGGIGDHF